MAEYSRRSILIMEKALKETIILTAAKFFFDSNDAVFSEVAPSAPFARLPFWAVLEIKSTYPFQLDNQILFLLISTIAVSLVQVP